MDIKAFPVFLVRNGIGRDLNASFAALPGSAIAAAILRIASIPDRLPLLSHRYLESLIARLKQS